MKKRGDGIVRKMTIGVVLAFMVSMLSGCSDSELEQDNSKLKINLVSAEINNALLKRNLVSAKTNNALLQSKLSEAESNNKSFHKELTTLRENNKGLNVSLAKSELLFSQKHKVKLEEERKNIDAEREKFKKEQKNIEKDAYENAEKNVANKYIGGMIGMSILAVMLLVLWFFMSKKNRQLISDKGSEIKSLQKEKEACASKKNKLNEKLNTFANTIEELKKKQQEGSKNQVVNAIDANDIRRRALLEGLRGNGHGN